MRTIRKLIREKQIEIGSTEPRRVDLLDLIGVDLIVNVSEYGLPPASAEVIRMPMHDPIGKTETIQREIRDQIESVVRLLIGRLRHTRA